MEGIDALMKFDTKVEGCKLDADERYSYAMTEVLRHGCVEQCKALFSGLRSSIIGRSGIRFNSVVGAGSSEGVRKAVEIGERVTRFNSRVLDRTKRIGSSESIMCRIGLSFTTPSLTQSFCFLLVESARGITRRTLVAQYPSTNQYDTTTFKEVYVQHCTRTPSESFLLPQELRRRIRTL